MDGARRAVVGGIARTVLAVEEARRAFGDGENGCAIDDFGCGRTESERCLAGGGGTPLCHTTRLQNTASGNKRLAGAGSRISSYRLATNVDVDRPVGHGGDQAVAAASRHSGIRPRIGLSGPDGTDRAPIEQLTADLGDDYVVALRLQLPYCLVGVRRPQRRGSGWAGGSDIDGRQSAGGGRDDGELFHSSLSLPSEVRRWSAEPNRKSLEAAHQGAVAVLQGHRVVQRDVL